MQIQTQPNEINILASMKPQSSSLGIHLPLTSKSSLSMEGFVETFSRLLWCQFKLRFNETWFEGASKHELYRNINLYSPRHQMKKLWCLNRFYILIGQFGISCHMLLLPWRFSMLIVDIDFFDIAKKTCFYCKNFILKGTKVILPNNKVQKI